MLPCHRASQMLGDVITMGLRQKNRFNECKACGCEPASNHMSGFGFSATDSDSGRRAHGSHERARSARNCGPEEACFGTPAAQSITLDCCRAESQRHTARDLSARNCRMPAWADRHPPTTNPEFPNIFAFRPDLNIGAIIRALNSGNSGFVVGERGFGPATALDTVDAPILKPSAFGRGWDLGACVNGGVEGRAGDAPLPPKWLITMGLRQKNRFNECKACGCEPASNHMSGFGFSATDSDSGRRAHGSHERARSARKGRKKHVSVLPRPNRSPWIVVEQNHNGIGKLMVPAFQIYANMNVINDL